MTLCTLDQLPPGLLSIEVTEVLCPGPVPANDAGGLRAFYSHHGFAGYGTMVELEILGWSRAEGPTRVVLGQRDAFPFVRVPKTSDLPRFLANDGGRL